VECIARGCQGNPKQTGDTAIHSANRRESSMKPSKWRWFRRRSAIEPVIGHMKEDHRRDRNYRKGIDGDKMNAILAECGFNFQPSSTSRSHPTLCKTRSVQIGQDGFQCDSGWSRSFHGLAACCPGLRIRCNYPYHGDADALLTAWRKKFSATYYLGIELEINQRHFLEKTVNAKLFRTNG
jgi:hypothetical protein